MSTLNPEGAEGIKSDAERTAAILRNLQGLQSEFTQRVRTQFGDTADLSTLIAAAMNEGVLPPIVKGLSTRSGGIDLLVFPNGGVDPRMLDAEFGDPYELSEDYLYASPEKLGQDFPGVEVRHTGTLPFTTASEPLSVEPGVLDELERMVGYQEPTTDND